MKKLFTAHPHSIGESYFQHLSYACRFGSTMVIGGVACLIHAIFPFLFKSTGSDALFKMMHFYIKRIPCMEERMVEISQHINEKKAAIPAEKAAECQA